MPVVIIIGAAIIRDASQAHYIIFIYDGFLVILKSVCYWSSGNRYFSSVISNLTALTILLVLNTRGYPLD